MSKLKSHQNIDFFFSVIFSEQKKIKKNANLLVNTLVVIEFDPKILIDTTLPNHMVIFKVNMLNLEKK